MSGIKARKWIVTKLFEGLPKRSDFEIVEEELPPLNDGEVLIEAQWITVDPYQRTIELGIKIGDTVRGGQVAKIVQSKHKDYAVGDLVVGYFGWVSHAVCNPEDNLSNNSIYEFKKIDPSIPLPASTALGILGMPGATAYFGLLDTCQPKAGETFLVNAAAGAVGSAIGQIAKIKGMRVVGFAGTDEKVEYLKSIGFDAAYNYKTVPSLAEAIKEGCPNGVDVFFDNVGGEFFDTVLPQMNTFGRISICGVISAYNSAEFPQGPSVTPLVLFKQLTIRGFIVYHWKNQFDDAFKEMAQWISEGKLQYREKVYEGFDSIYDAFMCLFQGGNIGKVVVKV